MNFVLVCDKSYIESATALSDKECSSRNNNWTVTLVGIICNFLIG